MGSDIGKYLALHLGKDGWHVFGTSRPQCDLASNESIDKVLPMVASPWDLLVIAAGTMEPIEPFFESDLETWERCIRVNALGPLRILRGLHKHANPGASVCFFSGTNPRKANPNYSAYSSGKALLKAACKDIDAETELKVFVIAPGFVNTKIHQQTIKAGVKNERLELGGGTELEQIYWCLKGCVNASKARVGGQVIFAPDYA